MFTVEDLLKATGGRLVQRGRTASAPGISIDSRTVKKGDCFVTIRGAHYDGADFAGEAVSSGAVVVVSHRVLSLPPEASLIVVTEATKALGDIAAFWRRKFSLPIVAITGSNGKSTTKEMTASALSPMGPVLKTEGNFNNLIGLPLTLLRLRTEHKVAVLEMGMNAPGEIAALTRIADPDVGVITNVSAAHLELLGTVENVARAKGELFENMNPEGTIVVNGEDPWVQRISGSFRGRKCLFGMQNDADIRFGRLESRGLSAADIIFYVGGSEIRLHLKVPGVHNVMNALAAVSVAKVLGMPIEVAVAGLEKFQPMAMRMERVQLAKGIQLVNDSYNANPVSVNEALRTVGSARRAGRFVAVLGDMLELGENAPRLHRDVGLVAARYKVDRIFAFGPHAENIREGAKTGGMNSGKVEVFSDIEALKKGVLESIATGDVVLVKGSRGMKMERVVDYLKDEIGVA